MCGSCSLDKGQRRWPCQGRVIPARGCGGEAALGEPFCVLPSDGGCSALQTGCGDTRGVVSTCTKRMTVRQMLGEVPVVGDAVRCGVLCFHCAPDWQSRCLGSPLPSLPGRGHRHKVVSCFLIAAFLPLPSGWWPLTSWLDLGLCGHCRNRSHLHVPDPVLSIFNPPPAPLRACLLQLVTAGGKGPACRSGQLHPSLQAPPRGSAGASVAWGFAARLGAVCTCLQVIRPFP